MFPDIAERGAGIECAAGGKGADTADPATLPGKHKVTLQLHSVALSGVAKKKPPEHVRVWVDFPAAAHRLACGVHKGSGAAIALNWSQLVGFGVGSSAREELFAIIANTSDKDGANVLFTLYGLTVSEGACSRLLEPARACTCLLAPAGRVCACLRAFARCGMLTSGCSSRSQAKEAKAAASGGAVGVGKDKPEGTLLGKAKLNLIELMKLGDDVEERKLELADADPAGKEVCWPLMAPDAPARMMADGGWRMADGGWRMEAPPLPCCPPPLHLRWRMRPC